MNPLDPRSAWQPYKPTDDNPWTVQKAGHLLRRACFGATKAELARALEEGPEQAVTRLLEGGPRDKEFEQTSEYMSTERSLPVGANTDQLAAWWLSRMLHNPHPLREKLSLFWHDHFATSNAKVANARYMLGQYRLIYEHALGNFGELLTRMAHDPAMLVWLDADQSTKEKPNENYARELMELFSLGIGHYTEKDIREAARAFTGTTLRGGQPHFDDKQHDAGKKTVLGQTGRWKPDDITRICLEQPACPRFIVGKLVRFLVNEASPLPSELIEPLANEYRESGFDTGKLVETVLRSNLFFSGWAYRNKIKSPVEYVLGIVRGLEARTGTLPLATALEDLGQVPFAPPSVKGWDGGADWLNAQTLLARQNLALALTSTEEIRFGKRCDPVTLLERHGVADEEAALDFLLELFLQSDVTEQARGELQGYAATARDLRYPSYWSETDRHNHRLRTLAHLVLTLPEFQLN